MLMALGFAGMDLEVQAFVECEVHRLLKARIFNLENDDGVREGLTVTSVG